MPKILLISAVFPPEPVVSALLSSDLAAELTKRHDVVVLCPRPTRPHGFRFENKFEPADYKVIRLNSYTCPQSDPLGRCRESYSFGRQCYRYIIDNSKNIDVIYANTWPLPAQYYTARAARKFNIPFAIHIQDIYPESLFQKLPFGSSLLNKFLLPFDKYVLKNANKIIAISRKMNDYLVKTRTLDKEKIATVFNWQDESDFTSQKMCKNDNKQQPFTFMYLGNIGPVAGVDFLVAAFVKSGLGMCKLVIAGSGSMKSAVQKQVRQYANCNIEFCDVPDGKVPEIQNRADVLLLPVKKGATLSSVPSKLPAYMFSAKPVIACVDNQSDTADAIREADCGWIVAPDSVDDLAQMMRDVAGKNLDILCEKGRNGFDYAMLNYSKKENLPQILKIIENAVA